MYQASTNVNLPQFTSTTTTTTNYQNLNNYNDLKQFDYAPNNGFIQQHLQQPQSQQDNYDQNNLCHQYEQINNWNSSDIAEQNNDGISFALDEIGAIIASKDFDDITATTAHKQQQKQLQNYYLYPNNYEQQIDQSQDSTKEETKAAIYENLKNIITADDDTTSLPPPNTMTTNNNSNRKNDHGNIMSKNYNLFNSPFELDGVDKTKPFIEIVEQPAKCALRFRYKCEGRSAGSLPGANSTADNKTFPSIRIANYVGRAVVVISCVTKEAPYLAHPHNIVGKEGCKKGICTIVINNESNMVRSFPSLGIQCVKRKDIEESLSLRESINVDPFRNGFAHKSCTSNIDLNVVRLCFQVFIEGTTPNKCDVPLTPVVSEPIHDKKAMSELVITKLSHCSAPATGGREVILLCDRISKDDIQIRFYEERDGKLIWETFTDLAPNDVHKQVAICFKTPKYYNENITQPVMVRIQLKRISDNQVSEPRSFQFLPCESDEDIISRKRQKIEWVNMNHYMLDNILKPNQSYHHHHLHHHHPQQPQHHIHQQQQQQCSSSVIPHQSQPPRPNHPQHVQLQPARSSPSHLSQQQQSCAVANQCNLNPQPHKPDNSSGSPSPLQLRRASPIEPAANRNQGQHIESPDVCGSGAELAHTTQQTPSPDRFAIDSQNLVVRREIIDNEGKVMRLVDRPCQSTVASTAAGTATNDESQDNNIFNKQYLASSLDRIDTAELMRDIVFNSNIDLNLSSGQ